MDDTQMDDTQMDGAMDGVMDGMMDENIFEDPSFNENVTIYDDFLDRVDKSIITGDTTYIEYALKTYGNQLHPESVKMGSTIIMQILEEKMEDIVLTSN
jgi:hypothetical protein